MSQYSSLYCDRGKARIVLQYSHCAHDTTREWALGVQVGAGRACVLDVQGARAAELARRWGAQGERARGRARCRRGRAGLAGRGTRRTDTAWTRGARGWGRQGRAGRPAGRACARSMGMLAGSAGPSWCTVRLAQF